MQTLSTTNQELREFRDWYADHHGTQPTEHSVFVTCLCGHFHTYPKAASTILREMKGLGRAWRLFFVYADNHQRGRRNGHRRQKNA